MLPVCRVCTYSMLYSSTTDFILYGRTMRTVHKLIALLVTLLLLLLLSLIVIYDCVGTYDETIIMDWYVVYDDDDDVGLCQSTC